MEIVFAKPIGENKVDSRLVLAMKKKKHKSHKKSAPSLRTLQSNSMFLSMNRLTNRVGLFCKGKASHHVKRLTKNSPQTEARVEQDLRKVLELVSRGETMNKRTPDTPAIDMPVIESHNVFPVPLPVRRASVSNISLPVTDKQRYVEAWNNANSLKGTLDIRESHSHLFSSLSELFKGEVKRNGLYYWNRARYLHLKRILCPNPNKNRLLTSTATSPPSCCSPVDTASPAEPEKSASDDFVLNVCSEFKKKISPRALDCFQEKENNVPRVIEQNLKASDILHFYPLEHPSRMPSCDVDVNWEPESIDSFKLEKRRYREQASGFSIGNDTVLGNLKSYEECGSSPMRPVLSDETKTPRVFFRRKMF